MRAVVPDPGKAESTTGLTSDTASAVTVAMAPSDKQRILFVESVQAELPTPPELPAWLGKRPPKPGDWVKTLDDEFEGTAINGAIWDTVGEKSGVLRG